MIWIYFWSILEPNDESGANVDAAKMWRENREEFNKIAEKIVRRTLGIPTWTLHFIYAVFGEWGYVMLHTFTNW